MLTDISDEFGRYLKGLHSADVLIILAYISGIFSIAIGSDEVDVVNFRNTGYKSIGARLQMPSTAAARSAASAVLEIPRQNFEYGIERIRQLPSYPTVEIYAGIAPAASGDRYSRKINVPYNGMPIGPISMDVRRVEYDINVVRMQLQANNFFKEPFQAVQFDPYHTPAMYL